MAKEMKLLEMVFLKEMADEVLAAIGWSHFKAEVIEDYEGGIPALKVVDHFIIQSEEEFTIETKLGDMTRKGGFVVKRGHTYFDYPRAPDDIDIVEVGREISFYHAIRLAVTEYFKLRVKDVLDDITWREDLD